MATFSLSQSTSELGSIYPSLPSRTCHIATVGFASFEIKLSSADGY